MTIHNLPPLRDCLETTTWRRLLAVMDSHGLPASTRWRKAELIATLHLHLLAPSNLRQVVQSLSKPAQEALSALLQAGGSLPARAFAAHFGQIRPHRPWRQDATESEPWRIPVSPAERLWYLGLLYLWPQRPTPGQMQQAVLPAELLDLVQSFLLTPQIEAPVHLLARPSAAPNLLWDVTLLLASIEEEPIRPLHGRWLPPRTLTALATRMGLERNPESQASRSEREHPYLAFIHHVAQAAELLTGASRFGLTYPAWQWLASDAPTRWQHLWQGWLHALPEAAAPFRFAWGRLSVEGRGLILDEIRQLPLGHFTPLPQIVAQAHLHDEWNRLAQPWDIDQDVVAALIIQPLHWFGVVSLARSGPEYPAPVPSGTPGSSQHESGRVQSVPELLVSLTALGAWLLDLPDFGPPLVEEAEPCVIRSPNYDLILVPSTTQPLHLARLAKITHWLPPKPPAPEQRLRLMKERVAQVVAHGMAVDQIFCHLEEALGRPPSRRQQQKIRQWAKAGQQVRVRRLTVLETADAQLMGALRSRKLIRRHLGEALSPTRSELNPAGVPALLKSLRTMDLYASPLLETTPAQAQAAGEPTQKPKPDQVELSAADAGLLLTAAHVYAGLGAHTKLPLSLPAETMEALAQQLTAAHQEASQHAARHVLGQIEAALQGYLALPSWHFHRDTERTMPAIETALADQHDLVLTYQGAVREQVTVRRVTPYWLEKRHKVLYLNAYCHLREAERVFRVDRIVECEIVERGK
jgi:hypothetical protein